MKKNNMLRLASVLLVAVLLSTCAISGVFAHYQTSGSTDDTASVAKWGVKIVGKTGTANTMFSDSYKDVATTWTENEQVDSITVQAKAEGTNVVAPGTEGTLSAFEITGAPEVDVNVTYTADLVLTGWALADTSVYCPIVFNVNGTEYKIDATNDTTAKLETAVENAIIAAKATYHTNTDLSTINDDLTVTWAWAFDDVNFANDTYLGDQAAAGNAATVSLTVGVTVTQID